MNNMMQSMNPQMQGISSNHMQGMNSNQLQNINPNQIQGIPPNQMQAMMQQQYLATMNNNQVQAGPSLVSKLFDDNSGSKPMQSAGTSIADLKKMQPLSRSPNQSPREQWKKQNDVRQQQGFSDSDQERDKIKHLVKDINKSLDDYGPSKMRNTEDSDDESDNNNDATEKEQDNDKEEMDNSKKIDDKSILDHLKEPLLLIIIYVILSQNFVRRTIGNYVSYINPREDGNVPLVGYILYGVILAVAFVFFKKILI